MANSYFRFKQFTIHQDCCAMKVTTDACLFGAWVARQIATGYPAIKQVLDIGAGTGLLSLMLAQQTTTIIDSVEIDAPAATQAAANVEDSPWKERIKVMYGDIRQSPNAYTQYDAIISNPPFYEREWQPGSERKNIAHHGGGLSLQQLTAVIKDRLSPTGTFFLLLPFKRKKEIEQLLKKSGLFLHQVVLVRQTTTHDHFRLMIAGSLQEKQGSEESEMAIRDRDGQYTPSFISLLKEYYLYL